MLHQFQVVGIGRSVQGMIRQDNLDFVSSLLIVLCQRQVVWISLFIYGMLSQDNQKPNQKVIKKNKVSQKSLPMVLHQHLAVEIILYIYGLLRQANIDLTIQRTCRNPILEAQDALIFKGEFVNYQGQDLTSLFKSKGSLILERYKELKQK
ncbi:unnamed protein product (macronuclear) [Paramecium tetraurelia]|uniref:Uncharacterized protein n=1 Tax=Paramecium tetraurelia TaxID=5888 RepID=A0CS08_PARTE|nr:uncharacterized protein GSPATT00038926001 [Paramecium tetraurelia]CAK73575.1 unnamed protein product [Paramecium tetraurelia]|eukprot:XP_001440972.1 hypothetical protein (macronuclear) [Paramecium tetraurelia strain d4-2]